jgi:hypothetical protein
MCSQPMPIHVVLVQNEKTKEWTVASTGQTEKECIDNFRNCPPEFVWCQMIIIGPNQPWSTTCVLAWNTETRKWDLENVGQNEEECLRNSFYIQPDPEWEYAIIIGPNGSKKMETCHRCGASVLLNQQKLDHLKAAPLSYRIIQCDFCSQ